MVQLNALRFCDLVGTAPLAEISDEFIGQLFSIPIKTNDPEKLKRRLFEKYKIEIPVAVQNGNAYLRYSIQAFNNQQELDYLYDSVAELLKEGYLFNSGK
jgi:isopenicillin-N epimerase